MLQWFYGNFTFKTIVEVNGSLALSEYSVYGTVFYGIFFLKHGHTQNENENDSIHSVTERKIKGVSIYHPYQWIILIESARKSKPYIEYPMCQEGFLHFQTDMNDKYNFLINKSTKDFSGDTTGTTIDGNNRKTKKTRWTEIRAAHLDK